MKAEQNGTEMNHSAASNSETALERYLKFKDHHLLPIRHDERGISRLLNETKSHKPPKNPYLMKGFKNPHPHFVSNAGDA